MNNKIVIRVVSKAGRSRIEIGSDKPFQTLKEELHQRLNVDQGSLQLFQDEKFTKRIQGRDTDRLYILGLKNGDMIYVANQDTKFNATSVSGTQAKLQEEVKRQKSTNDDVTMIDTSTGGAGAGHGSPSKKQAKPLTGEEVKRSHSILQEDIINKLQQFFYIALMDQMANVSIPQV